MERGISTLKALALATVPLLGLLVTVLLIQASSAIQQASKDETAIALRLQVSLDTMNRDCGTPGKIQPCGTLAEIDKTLTHVSDLSIQSQVAVRDADLVARGEMKLLPLWNESLTHTLANVDAMTATINRSAGQLTDATLPVISRANDVLASTDLAVKDVQTAVQNPDVSQTLHYISESSKSVADGTAQADAILVDGRKVADRYVNPPPKKWYEKVWNVVKTTGELVYDFIR